MDYGIIAAAPQPHQAFSSKQRKTIRKVVDSPLFIDNSLFHTTDGYQVAMSIAEPPVKWANAICYGIDEDNPLPNEFPALLTPEQEKHLFLEYNFLRYRIACLSEKIHKEQDGRIKKSQARKILSLHGKATECRNRLVCYNLGLAFSRVKSFLYRFSQYDQRDLWGEAFYALIRAVERFDVACGYKFSVYACSAINKRLSTYTMRLSSKLSKVSLFSSFQEDSAQANAFDISNFKPRHDGSAYDSEMVLELQHLIETNAAQLSDRQMACIKAKYFVDGRPTNDELGDMLGVSRESVRLDLDKAFLKLRAFMHGEKKPVK